MRLSRIWCPHVHLLHPVQARGLSNQQVMKFVSSLVVSRHEAKYRIYYLCDGGNCNTGHLCNSTIDRSTPVPVENDGNNHAHALEKVKCELGIMCMSAWSSLCTIKPLYILSDLWGLLSSWF